jgi:hypothetical protein
MSATETKVMDLLSAATVKGELDLPQFQREYNRTCTWLATLADSMYHGMRIEEVMLWGAQPSSAVTSRYCISVFSNAKYATSHSQLCVGIVANAGRVGSIATGRAAAA